MAHEVYLFAPLLDGLFREEGEPASADALAAILAQTTIDVDAGLVALYGAVPDRPGYPPIVGCVQLAVNSDPLIGWHYALSRLYVAPACRGRFLAGRLLRAAVSGAADPEATVLITTRGRLPRTYRRLGAKPYLLTSRGTLGDLRERLGLVRG